MACPDAADIEAFVAQRLARPEGVEAHLEECESCRQLVLVLARERRDDDTLDAGVRAQPVVGSVIGRYLVSRPLGAGGMGVVFAAWDPQLERRVAVKLLRPNPAISLDDLRARLVREAQAMARLSHRNVITVYEVGTLGDQLFVAMEHIDGTTVSGWLRAAPRTWKEIVTAFVAAGEGLAAAHQAGLIHRDFKPDNVLVGKDGRICVTDFGLARSIGAADASSGVLPASPLTTPLTRTGALLGTPAYMSPEQLEGARSDERSDLFSFCVALYEALFQVRPFTLGTAEEMQREMAAGPKKPPARGVPGWVTAAVLRGLQPDPADRPASMQELVALLRTDPGQKWLRRAAAAGFVALLGTSLGLGVQQIRAARHRCDAAGAPIDSAWNEGARRSVEQAFAGTRLGYRREAFGYVARALDGWSAAWRRGRVAACVAGQEGTRSAELLDLRMQCLEDRLTEARAVVAQLAQADAMTVARYVELSASLPLLSRCDDAEALRALDPLPADPARRAAIQSAREAIAHSRALRDAGKLKEAAALSDALVKQAQATDYAPVVATALADRAATLTVTDEPRAMAALKEAVAAAVGARDDDLAAQLWLRMAAFDGYNGYNDPQRRRLADDWMRLAQATLRRFGGSDALELLRIDTQIGIDLGRYDFAGIEQLGPQALALAERLEGARSARSGRALMSIAIALRWRGKKQAAIDTYRQAIDIFVGSVGEHHPYTAMACHNLSHVYGDLDRHEEALEILRRSQRITEAVQGADHPQALQGFIDIAIELVRLRRFDEAEAALANADKAGPPTPTMWMQRALIAMGRRDFGAARRARAEAYAHGDSPAPEDELTLGEEWLEAGERADALSSLEKAAAGEMEQTADHAEAQFALARAISDRNRAQKLATDALATLKAPFGDPRRLAPKVEAWLK